jgi:hypothetical protein
MSIRFFFTGVIDPICSGRSFYRAYSILAHRCCVELCADRHVAGFQIRSLDGVRLLWSLLKNQNEAVQVIGEVTQIINRAIRVNDWKPFRI